MKIISTVQRFAFLTLALTTLGITVSFAQTPPPPPPPGASEGGEHHREPVLTPDEKAQLKKAHDAAIAADPTLKTTEDSLKQQGENLHSQEKNASLEDKKAFHEARKDFEDKLRPAELKIDPTLGPIFAKLDAARKNWRHDK